MVKAIETRYKGYRFRSRLEARWAVFFDAFPLKWEYEPEGYDLGDAGYYLPDFFLPDMNLWVEVKPDRVIIDSEKTKIEALAKATEKSVLLALGVPSATFYDVFHYDEGHEEWIWTDACFQKRYISEPRLFWCPGAKEDADCIDEIEAARSARFEHGETP